MKKDQTNEETLLSHLVSWLNKHANQKQEMKKSKAEKKEMNAEEAIVLLSESLTKCLQEVAKITTSLATVIKAVNEHASMIEELYTVQTGILQLLKMNAGSTVTIDTKSSTDASKKKTEKPN